MKKTILFISFVLLVSCTWSQNAFTIYARPTEMSYCEITGKNGEQTCFAGKDMSGYLLHIHYKIDGGLFIRLFKDGEVMEDLYAKEITKAEINPKKIYLEGPTFEIIKPFHELKATGVHPVVIQITRKIRKGNISFTYPDLKKVYTYTFDLL